MKKLLLFLFVVFFVASYGQRSPENPYSDSDRLHHHAYIDDNQFPNPDPEIFVARPLPQVANRNQDAKSISVIPIGEAGNAIGFAYNRTTYLWADNATNSVSFTHRMLNPPGTGFLACDISKDGGLTWNSNIQVYDPTLPDGYNARYPQGLIFNPPGNIDPDNAYYHYFAPTLDGSNSNGTTNWGGFCWGSKQLSDGASPTQNDLTTTPPIYHYLPSGFTITQTGETWVVDENTKGDGTPYTFENSLTIGHGIWNDAISDFEYTWDLLELEIHPDKGINDVKIAFAPDGQTGWICALTQLPDTLPYTTYHPVFFKTTDGGESWSDEPIELQLGGADGFKAIQDFISDDDLEAHFSPDPVPPRDEIDYYIGYHMDLAVDAWGNPHISGTVCIADASIGYIYYGDGLKAMFHIWSLDQGVSWNALNLGDLEEFGAYIPPDESGIRQYNRPQVATTTDGTIVFFSWLDTDPVLGLDDNSRPDIWFRDYLPSMDAHSDSAENVTAYSAAWWAANFGCMSHYVFTEVTDNTYTCTIPFVYEECNLLDHLDPVQFYYIPDFIKTYTLTGLQQEQMNPVASVSQNFPNPFSTNSVIKVNLLSKSDMTLEVYDITGQRIKYYEYGNVEKGIHQLEIDASDMSSGIYFYSILAGSHKVTKKMIVQ